MLTEYRKSAGLSQIQMADLLGVSQPYVGRLETGDRKPGRKLACKIAEVTKNKVPVSHWDDETLAPQNEASAA